MRRSIQIDVLRGCAILLAMGWHLNDRTGVLLLDLVLAPGQLFGWAGVDLFFVLSGFLVGRLILRELRDTRTFAYKRFLIRRVFRLWPVLYLYLAAQLVAGNKPASSYLWQTLLHVQNYAHTPLSGLWSLAVEEHFYLCAGLLLPYAARRAIPAGHYVRWLLGIMVACFVLRCGAAMLGRDHLSVQTYSHYRFDAVAFGLLLAVVAFYHPQRFARLTKYKWPWLIAAISGFLFAGSMFETACGDTLGYTVAYLASGALLLAANDASWPRWADPPVRALAFVGLYSYSIYIWHYPVAEAAGRLALRVVSLNAPGLLLIKYGAAIAVACVVARVVERPMIALRDRLFPMLPHAGVQLGGEDLPTARDVDFVGDKVGVIH